jgi:hypothetical protein
MFDMSNVEEMFGPTLNNDEVGENGDPDINVGPGDRPDNHRSNTAGKASAGPLSWQRVPSPYSAGTTLMPQMLNSGGIISFFLGGGST